MSLDPTESSLCIGGVGICNRAVKICRDCIKISSARLTATPNDEAWAAEGWVTTGSRRLSRRTKRVGAIPDSCRKSLSNKDWNKHYPSFVLNHLTNSHETTIIYYLQPKPRFLVVNHWQHLTNQIHNPTHFSCRCDTNPNPNLVWR